MAAIKFEPNVPQQVQLKFSSGKPYGNQMMYSLADGNVMFVPQFVDKQLLALQVRRGDTVEISKTLVEGQVRWLVRRPDPKPQAKPATRAQSNGNSNGHGQPAAALVEQAENLDGPDVESYAQRNLEQALRISLMAAKKAEEYGQLIGKPVQFDKSDIRLMANTMLINGHRRAA